MNSLFAAIAILTIFAIPQANPLAQQNRLSLRTATISNTVVPCYGRLELTLDLQATYNNPFDPREIDVWAVFTSPKGKRLRVNGFLYQPCNRQLVNGAESITDSGDPVWKIRFAPNETGKWTYAVHATDRSGTVSLPIASFKSVSSKDPGFIGRSVKNPFVFAFKGEKPFFCVGENMGWGGKRGSYDYEDWLGALGKAGGNWVRIWMSSWNCSIEWTSENKGDWRSGGYHGLGVYSLDNAWKLDKILELCESNRVYAMVCLGTFGELTTGGYFNEGQWAANPYNAANGGPCAKPDDYFTNEEARRLYKQRLRYIAARWGSYTIIHSWEFWNEYNAPSAWVAEMAGFLKGTSGDLGYPIDPYGHLVTTTYGNDAVWKIPEIDFTQTHSYGTGNIVDHAPVVHADALASAVYRKPHLMAEFGIDYRTGDEAYDKEGSGVNLHNGLWSAAMSGDAGGAMLWYWDGYIHPKNLYGQFTALKAFMSSVKLTDGAWKPMPVDPPLSTSPNIHYTDLVVQVNSGWGKAPVNDFTILPTGIKEGTVTQFLYSPGKPNERTVPTFHVNYESAGRFVAHIDTVSSRAVIRITLDGKTVKELDLSAIPPDNPDVKPEYAKTEFVKQYNIYQASFDKDYEVDVPAGSHVITLDCVDGDWASVSQYIFTGYRSSKYPEVNCYGLSNGSSAIAWIQNGRHNWKAVHDKKEIPDLDGLEISLHGLKDGKYTAEWWDTLAGKPARKEEIACAKGLVKLKPGRLSTDVAVKLTPVR